MKLKLIVVGKSAFDFVKEGEEVYEKRLVHYLSFEKIILPDIKNPKNLSVDELKKKEGELILSKISNQDFLVLMDENGLNFTSVKFSEWINQKVNEGIRTMVFAIGGAFGFSKEVYDRSNQKISLSKMTFSHQLVRVIFLEQLYRAQTILKGEPYHHE
jgi:23S rRNA (pseudouridine1915-N3)-methyltransferase